MRKLTLNPETLAVVSFATSHETRGRGTAHAHSNDMAVVPVVPPDGEQGDTLNGEGGPTIVQPGYGGLETASCTQCDTCNGNTC
jgi:hypothetical protein